MRDGAEPRSKETSGSGMDLEETFHLHQDSSLTPATIDFQCEEGNQYPFIF